MRKARYWEKAFTTILLLSMVCWTSADIPHNPDLATTTDLKRLRKERNEARKELRKARKRNRMSV